jgi:hypothetical protein
MSEQILTILITSAFTGLISTLGTVAALNVHISYLREAVEDNRKSIARAHTRIDAMKGL